MTRPLVLLMVIGMVAADIGIGYNYKAPQNKYVPGVYRLGSNSNQFGSTFGSNLGSDTIVSSTLSPVNLGSSFGSLGSSSLGYDSFGSGRYGSAFGSDSLSTSSLGSSSLGVANLGSSNLGVANLGSSNLGVANLGTAYSGFGTSYYPSSVSSSVDSVGQPLYQYSGESVLNNGFQTQYKTTSLGKTPPRYHIQQQPTQVFKHFYVHAAPEEPEEPQPRTPIVLPPAQKHYKIIFVKTPSESRRSQTVIPVQPQNEEKTIVYVLVKKPEEEQELIVPKVEQKPPSKPEVFFVKYKNKEDSQTLIDNIVNDYNKGDHVTVDSSGVSDQIYNTASVVGDGSYSINSNVADGSYSSASGFGSGLSGVSTGTYNVGSGFDGAAVSTVAASDNDNLLNAVSSYQNQYDTPTQSESSIGSTFNGYSGYNLASANSGADINEVNIGSTVSPLTLVSTTASSLGYDGASALSTSQGVPHETYGVPKFRVK